MGFLILLLLPFFAMADEANNLVATADFLYWQADEDGMEYASKLHFTGSGATAEQKYRRLELDFNWDPGFRLGLEYLYNQNKSWNLCCNWTHLDSNASGSSTTDNVITDPIFPLFLVQNLPPGTTVSSHLSIHYNVIDFQAGCDYRFTKTMLARPYIGVRGALIDQKNELKATDDAARILSPCNQVLSTFIFPPTGMNASNNFHGIGTRIGSDYVWNFAKNWTVLGQISGSILRGQFRVKQQFATAYVLYGPGVPHIYTPTIYFSQCFWRNRCNIEGSIGIEWKTFFVRRKRQKNCSFAVLYEISEWMNQNQLAHLINDLDGEVNHISVEDPRDGQLSFQGLTIKAALNF